jgi:deazaflavin-dependent oxidoreductase (nitroreductase family)
MANRNDFNERIIDEFRANGGIVGGPFERRPLLLLHTTGAKTGEDRVRPLAFRRNGEDLLVFGTKGGAPTHPDWYHNLRADPRVTVEVGKERFDARARVTDDGERDRLWQKAKEEIPAFADYEQKTRRQIPVIVLERVA